jgi:hypothetical protein
VNLKVVITEIPTVVEMKAAIMDQAEAAGVQVLAAVLTQTMAACRVLQEEVVECLMAIPTVIGINKAGEAVLVQIAGVNKEEAEVQIPAVGVNRTEATVLTSGAICLPVVVAQCLAAVVLNQAAVVLNLVVAVRNQVAAVLNQATMVTAAVGVVPIKVPVVVVI